MCFNFFKKNKKTAVEPVIERSAETPIQPDIDVEAPADYAFKLQVEDESNSGRSRLVYDPSEAELEEAVDILKLCENSFLVFESRVPINNYTFIQANGYNHSDRTVYSEVQHIENRNGKQILSNYYKVMNVEAFKGVLKAFAQKSTPNLYDWDHLMDFDED